jgi:small subunit ribosomal protein S35
MPVDQDWTNVWPAKSIFKQNAVPLPLRQGFVKNKSENDGLPPVKYGNTELMKIPNFFHLTPPHIKKQCAAIKSNN